MCASLAVVILWRFLLGAISIVGLLFVFMLRAYRWWIVKQATLEVKAQPRVPMFECQKHAIMKEEHLIKHLDQKMCPYCWNDRVKTVLDSTMSQEK